MMTTSQLAGRPFTMGIELLDAVRRPCQHVARSAQRTTRTGVRAQMEHFVGRAAHDESFEVRAAPRSR